MLFQIETQKIIIIAAIVVLGALAVFFLYSVLVLIFYWLILLLPLLTLGGGLYVRTLDAAAGNVMTGIALLWAIIWYVLIFSKKPNWLRRILESLNRSLP
jgi:hypothetical protein